ncbi:MAG TPA: DUF5336 domain-containing protein [Pseudonocardiaceae bacterium]|nr:DUF5336 domain-containing protein [Pseudonocardiaceae bacterium]
MSFPSGQPGGYPGQPPQQQQSYAPRPAPRSNPLMDLGIPSLITLGVMVLGLANYFCSFGSGAASLSLQVMVLLAGGLLAGLHVLPRGPKTLPFAALLSTVGGLSVLAAVIQSSGGGTSTPTIEIIILILGLLQFLVAAFVLLLEYDLIKISPRPAVPYGAPGTFPQSGPFPQTPQARSNPQQQPPSQNQAQQTQQVQQPRKPESATHYVPAPPSKPAPQSTMFLQQPGQISQQQPQTPPPGGDYPSSS